VEFNQKKKKKKKTFTRTSAIVSIHTHTLIVKVRVFERVSWKEEKYTTWTLVVVVVVGV
jgi:hypothetical protein